MNIRTKIIEPYMFRVSCLATGFLFEKEYICLHSIGIENPSRKTENCMKVTIMEYLLSDDLSCSSLEEDIVRKDYRCSSTDLEKCVNMLDEVQLLIAGRRPEV